MIRAVEAQLVIPITMTITINVIRIPKSWVVAEPIRSRMSDVRMIASTNVGMTRKKSVIRISVLSVRPPTKPLMTPRTAPMKTVMTVARSPITMETLAPWTVRFSMERRSSSVPSGNSSDGGARRG